MNNEPDNSTNERLPKTDYFAKGVELVASFDQQLVTLYAALIAGIVVLLLNHEVSFWVGAALMLALTCFVLGIGHTLLHMAFTSKLLFLAESLANEVPLVPNAIEEEEPTAQAFARTQAYAQRMYASQLWYLMIGMAFGAVAVLIRLWNYAWRAGVVILALLVVLFVIAALWRTWNQTLRRFPPSNIARSRP